jgi:hypothetical protein
MRLVNDAFMKTNLIGKVLAVMAMLGGLSHGQELVWEVDATSILAAADPDVCEVKVDRERRAWIVLQNETQSRLVQVDKNGVVQVWTLPASDHSYRIRYSSSGDVLVQAGKEVTRVVRTTQRVDGKKTRVFKQRNVVLPDDAEGMRYESQAEHNTELIWYYMVEGGAVKKIVLRKAP